MKKNSYKLNGRLFHLYLLCALVTGLIFKPSISIGQVFQPPTDCRTSIVSGQGIVSIEIPDSTAIGEIEVLIGSNSHSSDLFSQVFVFDQASGLPAGSSYSRNGLEINIGIDSVAFSPVYYTKVRLKNTSGTWSNYFEYFSN